MSRIEDQVIAKIQARAEAGRKKYGQTMERTDLSPLEWLRHLQEELMDAAVYAERLSEQIGGWVSVDQELPPFGELVWIVDDHGAPNLCQRHGSDDDWDWHEADFAAFGITRDNTGCESIIAASTSSRYDGQKTIATHWHSLPKLPKL